jgi:hypothetical protein
MSELREALAEFRRDLEYCPPDYEDVEPLVTAIENVLDECERLDQDPNLDRGVRLNCTLAIRRAISKALEE